VKIVRVAEVGSAKSLLPFLFAASFITWLSTARGPEIQWTCNFHFLRIISMKKCALIIAVFAVAANMSALLVGHFRGWHDLEEKSPDIFVARCVAAQDLLEPRPKIFYGNVFNSDIEVVSVLKGAGKPGAAHLVSLTMPYRGEYFLAFGTQTSNSLYSVIEEYRIVPLLHFHGAEQLAGKPLNEQIKSLLTSRLNDLNDEIAQDTRDKNNIEQYLKGTEDAAKLDREESEKSRKAFENAPFTNGNW